MAVRLCGGCEQQGAPHLQLRLHGRLPSWAAHPPTRRPHCGVPGGEVLAGMASDSHSVRGHCCWEGFIQAPVGSCQEVTPTHLGEGVLEQGQQGLTFAQCHLGEGAGLALSLHHVLTVLHHPELSKFLFSETKSEGQSWAWDGGRSITWLSG